MNEEVPVRFSMSAGSGQVCGFTAYMPFSCMPGPGHTLSFTINNQLTTNVISVIHFPEDTSCLILTGQLTFDSLDEAFSVIDWFKAKFRTSDFTSNSDPASYYGFYRSLITVLGMNSTHRPQLSCDPKHVKLVAECCRAILMAELNIVEESIFNTQILRFHELVIVRKRHGTNSVDLFNLVKEWETEINHDGSFKWKADKDICLKQVKIQLVKHKLFEEGFYFSTSSLPAQLDNYGAHR